LALRHISVRSLKEIPSVAPCVPKGIITIVFMISQHDQGTLTARKYTVPVASLAMCKHAGAGFDLQGWKIQFLTVKPFLVWHLQHNIRLSENIYVIYVRLLQLKFLVISNLRFVPISIPTIILFGR
jgi:hypothetical protein